MCLILVEISSVTSEIGRRKTEEERKNTAVKYKPFGIVMPCELIIIIMYPSLSCRRKVVTSNLLQRQNWLLVCICMCSRYFYLLFWKLITSRSGRGARYAICMSVCLSVSLSVRSHISTTTHSNFTKFSVHDTRGRDWVLLWQQCNTLCTSGIVHDVMFSHNKASGPY